MATMMSTGSNATTVTIEYSNIWRMHNLANEITDANLANLGHQFQPHRGIGVQKAIVAPKQHHAVCIGCNGSIGYV